MAEKGKNLSSKQKIIVILSCVLAAAVFAAVTVCIILRICRNKLSDLSGSGSYLSAAKKEYTIDDYDIVEIIEPSVPYSPVDIKTETVSEFKELIDSVVQTDENTVVVKHSSINTDNLSKRNVKLPVKCVYQNPELPSGSEITSLATVLNYFGYGLSKVDLSDNYLEKSIDKIADFWKVFLGDPKSNGFGCYAQPIVDAANKYLKSNNQKYVAVNYSGNNFEKLLKQVENGNPVIIWSTTYDEKTADLHEPYATYKWEVDGKTVQWISPEHCMVLIGYDIDKNIAIVSDPQRGIVEYNLETVKARYSAMHSQCVILKENNLPPVINGVKGGETYYTTQYITVDDYDLMSVTVNDKTSNNEFFIEGNTEKTYKITAKDKFGNTTEITVYIKPIASITETISNITELNITETDKNAVENALNIAKGLDLTHANAQEKSEVDRLITKFNALSEKINRVLSEYNRILTEVVFYENKDPLQIADRDMLEKLIADIQTFSSSPNLTEQQQAELRKSENRCKELLAKIPAFETRAYVKK